LMGIEGVYEVRQRADACSQQSLVLRLRNDDQLGHVPWSCWIPDHPVDGLDRPLDLEVPVQKAPGDRSDEEECPQERNGNAKFGDSSHDLICDARCDAYPSRAYDDALHVSSNLTTNGRRQDVTATALDL